MLLYHANHSLGLVEFSPLQTRPKGLATMKAPSSRTCLSSVRHPILALCIKYVKLVYLSTISYLLILLDYHIFDYSPMLVVITAT